MSTCERCGSTPEHCLCASLTEKAAQHDLDAYEASAESSIEDAMVYGVGFTRIAPEQVFKQPEPTDWPAKRDAAADEHHKLRGLHISKFSFKAGADFGYQARDNEGPTAWAYGQVCKANDAKRDELAALKQELGRIGTVAINLGTSLERVTMERDQLKAELAGLKKRVGDE